MHMKPLLLITLATMPTWAFAHDGEEPEAVQASILDLSMEGWIIAAGIVVAGAVVGFSWRKK